ncbi:MAG: BrnT family toxin, partial [Lachnospiraceae bacterium]|nr:BrnT family toxin [Lachnospiraceae bacterium]
MYTQKKVEENGILKFEWDDDKNELNLKKHGIDFETAMLVFNDLHRIEIYDME